MRCFRGFLFLIMAFLASSLAYALDIEWSGYHWTLAGGRHKYPGPNDWDVHHVWVDGGGGLNLKIDSQGSAGIMSQEKLGYGTYTWIVQGDLGHLDPNIVMGMFQYPDARLGPDKTHEIDIEISQWGDPKNKRLQYSIWPNHLEAHFSHYFNILDLRPGRQWVFKYTRYPSRVEFGDWTVTSDLVSNAPMQIQMNLWAYKGRFVKPTTIRILKFKFEPY